MTDSEGMDLAIEIARIAQASGQRPFGSVIVDPEGNVIGQAGGTETILNPIKHSEIQAIRAACFHRGGLLHRCTLYQTLEPCPMCCGAINHSKISRVVVGAMRIDLPHLFRQRDISIHALLNDTSTPTELVCLGSPYHEKCVALFDYEIPEPLIVSVRTL